MEISAWKAALFLAGGIVAVATGGYVTGAFEGVLSEPPAMVAALPDPAEAVKPDQPEPAAPPQTSEEEPSAPAAAGKAGQPSEEKEVLPPSFDIVRVEPDGSVVIAGKASPGSAVEVLSGTTVIAKTVAGPAGDFAVVLEERLKPGDYQIVLRSTTPEGVVAASVETAVVSVPDAESGQVLALVEEPGKPSKLITVPEAAPKEEPAAKEEASAQKEPATVSVEPAASEEPATESAPAMEAEAPAAPADEAEGESEAGEAIADDTLADAPAGPVLAGQEPAVKGEMSVTDTPTDTPAVAASQPKPEGGEAEPDTDIAMAKPEEPAAEIADAPKSDTGEQAEDVEIAKAEPSEPVVEAPAAPAPAKVEEPAAAPKYVVRVEAVEIEGRKIFVAGQASSNMVVRVYANDILLGEARASQESRFLVETERDLPVGDYIIRADLLDDGGRKVVARAAVPFQREAGEAIAAVAPPMPAVEAPAKPAKTEMTEAPAAEEGAVNAAESADGDMPAKAGDAEASAPAEAVEPPAKPEQAGDAPAKLAEAPATPEQAAGTNDATPAKPEEVAAAPDAKAPEPATTVTTEAGGEPAEKTPAPQEVAAADPAPDDQVEEITAPKLQSVQGAVIIRRGDTLWRISRRVYGRGIRYSTIYVANQDQIYDPDRIWPGQVFRVPDKTGEGESADMEAMGEQMTTVDVPPEATSVE